MANSLSLSLQAFPSLDKDKQSLQYLISRINSQQGSFRNVSEQSLREEIQAVSGDQVDKTQEDVVESVEVAEAAKTKKEEVSSAREEIFKHITLAHNESVQALDFVSLLLSGKIPAVAQTTISPYIKQHLPLGSFGGEAVQASQVSEADSLKQEMASIGWRMQSLNGAADSLLKSASRLEEEMEKETTYWNQVLTVKDNGWSLSKLPREKHTLGVRYGFAEAHADFRDCGLAALRRNTNGSLSLGRGNKSKGTHKLRVRIFQQGRPIASTANGTNDALKDRSIEEEILDARNNIFDEELHHEIHREARNLVNQGVRCVDGCVLLPFEIDKQIEIDLIHSVDDTLDELTGGRTMADTIAVSLRVLLSHAHRQALRNRSQMAPPLREQPTSRPTYGLLKPILEKLQHQSHMKALRLSLESTRRTLSAAGLDFSIEITKYAHDLATIRHVAEKEDSLSKTDALVRTVTLPLLSSIKIWILDGNSILAIDVRTALQHYGTSFQVSLGNKRSTHLPEYIAHSMQFTDFATLEKQILHLTTLAILQHLVLSTSPGKVPWRTISPHSNSIMRNRLNKDRDKEIITIDLVKNRLAFNLQRNGRRIDLVTWAGEDDTEMREKERPLIDLFNNFEMGEL